MPERLSNTNSTPDHSSTPLSKLILLTAQAVHAVLHGQSLTFALEKTPAEHRPGVQALSFHVMRWLGSARWVLSQLMPKKPPATLEPLLLTSLALLWPTSAMPYASHTVVNQTVTSVRQRTPGLASVANAVLRRFLREQTQWTLASQQQAEATYNHPSWWIKTLETDWPDHAENIMSAAQNRPPLMLRVNQRITTPSAVLQCFHDNGIESELFEGITTPDGRYFPTPYAIVIKNPLPVQKIPGFTQGWWSVQDAAAQLAAPLLLQGLESMSITPEKGHKRLRVLDACAAPGGKTAHLLEMAPLDLWSLDADAQRFARIKDNLDRLQLGDSSGSLITLQATDARDTKSWWDGALFDAILLDAPCSASGIIRRHPDARWLRRPSDIPALAQIQSELLQQLWPLLRPGGRLLYATCSVFKTEGQYQVDAFMQRINPKNTLLDSKSPQHLLPLVNNESKDSQPSIVPDGFFYGLIHKF